MNKYYKMNLNLRENLKMTDKEILEKYDSERQKVECWSRVMGYFRPLSHYNIGKKSEFAERKWFKESKILKSEKAA